ncbi:hypothetical protein VNO77_21662 [Canavalia gladiata]|uniref:non-specific serine/threonine protein kinase n=1 Tax=Canavalia gladiata TaxID=3824 RepID=A0AAN9LV14_CANGL
MLFRTIIIAILIFSSFHHTTSLPPDASLSTCHNTTFNCGTITSLSYPFTGGERPSFCGPPQFHLSCNKDVPELNISSVSYRVLQVDSVTLTLSLARSDLWNETCTNEYVNSTFDDTSFFRYGSGNQNLTLFYECKPNSAFTQTPDNLFHCDSNGYKNDSYSVVGPFSLDPILGAVECDHLIEVPILEEQAKRLVENRSLLGEVLMEGFNVKYENPNESECSQCLGSGGQFLCVHEGASAAGFGVAIVFILIICYRKKRINFGQERIFMGRRKSIDSNVEVFMRNYGSLAPKRYSYSEIKRITNTFVNKLGQGGYGVVYKAKLSDDRPVAVKVISESKGTGEEFINEVASISRTSHVNIVSLIGFCYEKEKRALIYEFMPNGSLDKFIYKSGSPDAICNLDWYTLYQIAIGIARGLDYLHRGCSTRILHLDIKPQNILLDEDFCPKISDFGLAKICQKKESIVSLVGTRGTIGYIAPEVFSRTFGGVSHKSDVYSYGMLILEIIGGRKNYASGGSHTSEMYFPDWIYKDLEQGDILANSLVTTEEENEKVRKMTLVSLWCVKTNPSDRPSMSKVVEMLEGPLDSVPYPPKPVLYSPAKPPLQISDISSSNIQETNSITTQKDSSTQLNELNKSTSVNVL